MLLNLTTIDLNVVNVVDANVVDSTRGISRASSRRSHDGMAFFEPGKSRALHPMQPKRGFCSAEPAAIAANAEPKWLPSLSPGSASRIACLAARS